MENYVYLHPASLAWRRHFLKYIETIISFEVKAMHGPFSNSSEMQCFNTTSENRYSH